MKQLTGLAVLMACFIVVTGGWGKEAARAKEAPPAKAAKAKTAKAKTAKAKTAKAKTAKAKTAKAKDAPPKKDVRFWYQLVNVTIPPDSALRLLDNIDKPPQIYVIFKKDGKQLGETTVHTGWTVDFPHKLDNQFPVRIRSDAVYTIELWDDDTFGDQNIVNITQIKGEEFAEPIYQKGGEFEDKKSLAYITWKKIKTPDEYQ
jgi:hypothetical protein